jgi:AraC family transcriptional regulator
MKVPAPDSLRDGATTYLRTLGPAGGQVVRSVLRVSDGGSIAAALYSSPAYDLQLPGLKVSRLSINLTASRVNGGMEGERGRAFLANRHSVFLTPAGAATRWSKSSPSRHVNIYFHSPLVLDDAEDELGRRLQQGGPIFNVILPGSSALVDRLALELTEEGPFALEAVESLALLLLVQFVRQRLNPDGPRSMSAQQMTRLDEFIAANLGERILVADLAAVAGLPAGRFAQAFTRHTGRSPHQYVLSRRVEHATAMLRRGQDSLAEVAASCGFASQQHMTRVLRVRLGITPAALREALSAHG